LRTVGTRAEVKVERDHRLACGQVLLGVVLNTLSATDGDEKRALADGAL
jgi:hypothetical protein